EVFRFIATNGETAIQVSKSVQPISQTPVKDKTLTIQHSGAYIARYSITWEEVTVDKDGNQVVRSHSWEGNGRNQRKLAAGCSKHCFEVVDKTDEVSHIYNPRRR
ncbi:thiol-activated cytolysin C-terminal domain-containing protein, partial [Streptococcus pneumoniae]|uniref:thiol-activated cytolysin C-terminal domain-containing protein n=1 Tax=Streptococcus pneumoniae TaxID=1313 RepID=UPI000B1C2279